MNDWIHLGGVALRQLGAHRAELHDVSVLDFVVWPTDCDVNRHLNNGRYLQRMDMGRLSMCASVGLIGPMVKNRWSAVVGAVELEFLKELQLFARFELRTQIVGWDSKWFYIEQRFMRGDQLCAVGRIQALFRGARGRVSPSEVIAELGAVPPSPQLPRSFERLAAPSPLRVGRPLTVDDLPGLGAAA